MSGRPGRRRGHTRWLLIAPLAGLALIVAGVVALEAAAPEGSIDGLTVPDLPEVALDEAPECTRGGIEETTVPDIREDFEPGGRVASSQVYACPVAWDGVAVTFVGEAVGEILRRRGGAWVQVNDDAYALEVGPVRGHREHAGFNSGLPVWLPDGLHERVGDVGRAGQRGDVIVVRGTVLQADPADGGGLTIRADELDVLATATPVEVPLHLPQLVAAVLLAATAIASLLWARRVRHR